MSKKKSVMGIIGFFFGLAVFPSFGLAAIPGSILCIIGIIRKGHRLLASIGLMLCLFGFILLSIWTAPGSIPYPISIAKYCLNAPSFWVSYDRHHLCEAQSQYWFFGGAGGALNFKAESPKTFEEDTIITFASKHKWEFLSRAEMTEDDFKELLDENGEVKPLDDADFDNLMQGDHERIKDAFRELREKPNLLIGVAMGGQFPLWIRDDCIILSFDTGNVIDRPSYIVVNGNGTEMAVYYDGMR